jgi:hypothetical protein
MACAAGAALDIFHILIIFSFYSFFGLFEDHIRPVGGDL